MSATTSVKRIDAIPLLSVSMGLLNMDPDTKGPRRDSQGHGLASRASQTRAARMLLAQEGHPILIEPGPSISEKTEAALAEVNPDAAKEIERLREDGGKSKQKKANLSRAEICKIITSAYVDIGLFGGVVAHKQLKNFGIRGVVAVDMMATVDPIHEIDMSITRCVADSPKSDGDQTMGRQTKVEYALYRGGMHVCPFLAAKYGYEMDKIQLFFETYLRLPTILRSAQRGSPELVEMFVCVHDDPYGNMPFHEFERRVITEKTVDRPKTWRDYRIQFDDTDLPNGVKILRLEDLRQSLDCLNG